MTWLEDPTPRSSVSAQSGLQSGWVTGAPSAPVTESDPQPTSPQHAREHRSPRPRRVQPPKWLDLRLVAGVVLIIGSVLVGARVVSSADSSVRMWSASRNLAAGAVLQAGDLTPVQVHLDDGADVYYVTGANLVGLVLTHDLSAGELVPRAALAHPQPSTTVTIPLDAGQAPRLSRGQRVQLWLSSPTCPATLVLADVTVQDVQTASGGLSATGVQDAVVQVPADQAQRVIQALGITGATLRAGVLSTAAMPVSSLGDLSICASHS